MTFTKALPSSPVLQRLLLGLGSTALQPLATAIIQLGTVPLLLHYWGVMKYGDWIALSAVPAYLSLTNLGFGDASGSDMTVQVAAGNKEEALRTFQSSLALVLSMSLVIAALVATAGWVIPWQSWIKLSTLSNADASSVVFALAGYMLVNQQCGVLESGFRCDGNFATGTVLGTLLRLVETVFSAILGIVTGSLFWAAMGLFIARTGGTFFYAAVLNRKSPWIKFGLQHARRDTIRRLAGPAIGFMALPLASALTINGLTLVVASLEGSIAVTAFSTLRTLTRVNFQLLTVIAWAIWPELSRAFGAGDIPLARALHRAAYQSGLVISLLTGVALWVLGPTIYRLWLHNSVPFQPGCFHVLVAVTFANSLWFTSSVVPMSTNAHHRIALALVFASLLCLGIGYVATAHFGLTGTAFSLLGLDVVMICIVLRTSLQQLHDRATDFFRAMLLPPAILTSGGNE